eukprot:10242054-Alexandrium_andersonii.AAC.1
MKAHGTTGAKTICEKRPLNAPEHDVLHARQAHASNHIPHNTHDHRYYMAYVGAAVPVLAFVLRLAPH